MRARKNMSLSARTDETEKLYKRLLSHPAYCRSINIVAYMSFGSEVQTKYFAETVIANDKALVLPRVVKKRQAAIVLFS